MGAGHAHLLYVHEHSAIHRLAPEVKIASGIVIVVAVAVTPRTAVWAFGLHLALLAALVRLARLPLRFVLARASVILPFVLFAVLLPFIATGERVVVAGIAVSREGLWGAFNVVAKAGLGVTVSIVLAGTTEVARLLVGLERLHVPPVLTQIAAFMLRYLEIVAGELTRMRNAMAARGYEPRWLWQARPVAAASGALFIRSYERGERVHQAMLARGFTGVMPDVEDDRATAREWLVSAVPAVLAVVVGATAGVLA